jgi:anti-sigma factor RsiW
MMNVTCDRIRDRLWDWLDGTLDECERAAVESHVSTCAACGRAAEERRGLWAVLAADVVPPHRDLTQRILTAAAAQPPPVVQPHHWLRWAGLAAAAAALLAALALVVLLHPGRSQTSTPGENTVVVVPSPTVQPERPGYLETQLVKVDEVSDLELLMHSDFVDDPIGGDVWPANGT